MTTNRVAAVEAMLDQTLRSARPAERRLAPDEPLAPAGTLSARRALELFEDQYLSRTLDVVARRLKQEGRGFYTISSAGHEQNAVLGALLRPSDPCLLHYRAGAMMMARARKLPGATPLFDTLLSLCAAADDPVSGGRHKVWGSHALWVPPQTSTIASHLPKALGLAWALGRARRMGVDTGLPVDAIVCCSFGDASINHATALAGIHAARYARRRGTPAPILFVCEDNERGISVDTPRGWVRDCFANLPHLEYVEASGPLDVVWERVRLAIQTCRTMKAPVFLHLSCVRLWGHAGSDMESAYRSLVEIEEVEARDPLLANARLLVERGAATPDELLALVGDTRARAAAAAEEAARRRHLASVEEIVAPLAPYDEKRCRRAAALPVDGARRAELFGGKLPDEATQPGRRTLAAHLNAALADALAQDRRMLLFGEDVGRKGGVYGVTMSLQQRFGAARVFDTLLDETSILGVAQGAAQVGLLPVPEISYLAYVHNALDQLRGEACSLAFFSAGRFTNPMVVRIAGLGYQKGFGGHFHNDDSIGALRDIPSLMIAAPARGDDAARLLRGALAVARGCGRVVVFLEPIALYHERDLHAAGDEGWLSDYPPPGSEEGSALLPGEVGVYQPAARDLLIVSYANGLRLALRAARVLEREHGLRARVLDLRWLAPLPFEAVREHARECGRVLVVDECRRTGGGVADALVADLARSGFEGALDSVASADSYVPLGPAAELVLVSQAQIEAAALELAGR